MLWASYFDEGIFGNYGCSEPLGSSGLVAWARAGERVYEFEPTGGLDSICDCYALNVASERDVWLYYYTAFPLVRLRDMRILESWNHSISGSRAFAVSDSRVLFLGGYADRDAYHLLEFGDDGQLRPIDTFEFRDEEGARLEAERVAGRGDGIWLEHGSTVHYVNLRELPQ